MSDPLLFKESLYIESDCVDFKKELRLSSLLRYFQEVATHHLSSLGISDSFVRSLSLHWVVSRYHVEIKRVPLYEEKLLIETHAAPIRAFFFPRHFNVYDEKGDLIIRAASLWALVEEAKKAIALPSDYPLPEFGKLYGDELPFSLSLRLEKEGERKELAASYSFCDINGHVNNCAYFDLLFNKIPASFLRNHSPKEIDIQYKKEILMDEIIPLYISQKKDLYSFYSDKFLATISFEEKE